MNMYWFVLFGLILSIDLTLSCPVSFFGNLTVQPDFNLHHFLGKWYEIKWYSNETHNETELWNDYFQIFQLVNNSNEYLYVTGKGRFDFSEQCVSLDPWLIYTNNSAKMFIEKQDFNNTMNLHWPYYILKTNYNHYALIYACMSDINIDIDECFSPHIWLLSRKILLSNEYLIEIDEYLRNHLCINLTALQTTLHSEESCSNSSSLFLELKLISISINILFSLFIYLTYK